MIPPTQPERARDEGASSLDAAIFRRSARLARQLFLLVDGVSELKQPLQKCSIGYWNGQGICHDRLSGDVFVDHCHGNGINKLKT